MKQPRTHKASYAFTLAELLIALAILGVIATFTIPKVLQAQQNERYNAIAKEVASMISGAYQASTLNNPVSANLSMVDLTPYMNYVAVDTTSQLDNPVPSGSPMPCSTNICLKLHNGGILLIGKSHYGNTSTTANIWIDFDPDGTVSNYGSVNFFILYTGQLTSAGAYNNTTCNSYNCVTTNANWDPPWFHWN